MGLRGAVRGILAAGACALALGAPPALASTRTFYVSPTGTPSDETACSQEKPCQVEEGVAKAKDGDSVLVLPGNYELPLGGIRLTEDVEFGGRPGAVPKLKIEPGQLLQVDQFVKATVHDLRLEGDGGLSAGTNTIAQRIYVKDWSTEVSPCALEQGAVLRDSVCWATKTKAEAKSSKADAVSISPGSTCGEGMELPVVLRNVTAITLSANGHAIRALGACNSRMLVNAANVIARAANQTDVATEITEGVVTEAHVLLSHSNFETTTQEPSKTTVTLPTEAGNQSAVPLFVDAASGDFHQAPGSPTLDGGVLDGFVGPLDLDGAERAQPRCIVTAAVPDIGAYESAPNGACPPPPPVPPVPPEPRKPYFHILAIKLNEKAGTGRVEVEAPGPGVVSLTGSGIKLVRRNAGLPGDVVSLPIQPWAITRVRLTKLGKTKVRLKLTFEPKVGGPLFLARGLQLRKHTGHRRAGHRHAR